jgi:hypothetical protein
MRDCSIISIAVKNDASGGKMYDITVRPNANE